LGNDSGFGPVLFFRAREEVDIQIGFLLFLDIQQRGLLEVLQTFYQVFVVIKVHLPWLDCEKTHCEELKMILGSKVGIILIIG
jgi:hypothetical protein